MKLYDLSEILNRISTLLGNRQQKELTNYLGLKNSAYSDWKRGQSKSYQKYLIEIAKFFDVSIDYLVYGKEHHSVIKKDIGELHIKTKSNTMLLQNEKALLDTFNTLPPKEQQRVQNYAEMLQEYIEEGKPPITFSTDNIISTSPIRRYEYSAGAGFNTPAPQPDKYTIINLPQSCIPHRANSIIHISGDSMEPDYPNDCWVWVNTNVYGSIRDYYNKEVIAINEGEALFKICEPTGLRSINSKYKIIYAEDGCYVIGEVLRIVDLNEMLKGL